MRDPAGQPVDNVVKKAAEDFLTNNEHALPMGPGPHKVTYDVGVGLGIVGVVDDTSLLTLEVTVEIEFPDAGSKRAFPVSHLP